MGASRESGITLALLIATLCAHSNLAYRPSSGREMRDERCTSTPGVGHLSGLP